MDGLADCVQTTLQLKEKGLREEVMEELREAVWEEVREEVRETVREEVRQEMEEAAVTSHKPLNMDEQNFLQLFTNAQQGLPESFQGGRMVPLEEHGRQWGPLPPHLNVGGPNNQEKPPPSVAPLRNESEDQPFVKMDGREDASLQPHQEASVPPFPQMAPGPMMVPPGARPMVVTMPGMPPMGWYPYMPLPMFMTPQMNMLPHVMPPIAPEQGPDEQPMVQSEVLSSNKGVEPTEEPHTEEVTVEGGVPDEVLHPCVGPHPERGEGGAKVATGELPSAFPSADLQNDADISEGESPVTAHGPADSGTKESSAHPTTLEIVTPQAQFAQNLDDISPSTEPVTSSLLPGDDQPLSAQGAPQAPQPGLPCRRRDINDIDRALEEGEQGQGKEEKEDVPPSSHTQQKQNPKLRSRQSGSHRNKPRDGLHHGAGKSQSKGGYHGRQGQRYTAAPPVDGSPVPTPSLRQPPAVSHPSEPQPSSPTQLKPSTFNQPQLQASGSPVSGAAGVKNGEEASAKLSADGVKGNQTAGRDSGTGTTKSTFSGGKGGGGGGRGGKGGRGKGGKDTAPGSKMTTEGNEQAPTKNEDRVKVDSVTGDTSEGKGGRPRGNYQKSSFKQKEGRKVSGGAGGYRSHRPQQQNSSSQPNSSGNQDGDITSNSQPQRPKGGSSGGGKSAKWDGKKMKKVTAAAISDSASSQQEPTRSGRSNLTSHTPLVTDCTLPKPLPSFKNLYSSSPQTEGRDFSPPVQEDSWPCLATTVEECDLENHTSPCQYSPGSPTLTGVSKQSSPPNFSFTPTPPTYAQCTFDSTLSHHDVWSWTSADDALKFFPALRTTATVEPPT